MVYPAVPSVVGNISLSGFLLDRTNVYKWVKELPQNKAVLSDAGLPHPYLALRFILIMIIFAGIIRYQLQWQSHTELFRAAKSCFGSQSKWAGSLSLFSSFILCYNSLLTSPLPCLVPRHPLRCDSEATGHFLHCFWCTLDALLRVFLSYFTALEQD